MSRPASARGAASQGAASQGAASQGAASQGARPGRLSAAQTHEDSTRWVRQLLIVLLAVNSGAIDAIGFIALGGAFSSVMTGNMVLIGISAAEANGALAITVLLSLVCFMCGCAAGARIVGKPKPTDSIWPTEIRRVLAVELALVVAVLIVWLISGPDRSNGVKLAMLGANALALGLQSSGMQKFGVSGLSTTYLTGTLTTVVSRLVLREPVREVGHSITILLGLIVGAGTGALLAFHANSFAALLPVVMVAAATITPLLIWKGKS
ncbi:YoaK family protein [Nakamurella antarctica]|uniref:YoaK family protein n=1 Tax=Nakamurella antarctica TaxID=1902245 RepID=UPI0013DE1BEE|nr:YoaK family protein [Nakamurella antarctica]